VRGSPPPFIFVRVMKMRELPNIVRIAKIGSFAAEVDNAFRRVRNGINAVDWRTDEDPEWHKTDLLPMIDQLYKLMNHSDVAYTVNLPTFPLSVLKLANAIKHDEDMFNILNMTSKALEDLDQAHLETLSALAREIRRILEDN